MSLRFRAVNHKMSGSQGRRAISRSRLVSCGRYIEDKLIMHWPSLKTIYDMASGGGAHNEFLK